MSDYRENRIDSTQVRTGGRGVPSGKKKEKEKEGLLPVGGLNILKANSRSAAVVGDLARRAAAPAA